MIKVSRRATCYSGCSSVFILSITLSRVGVALGLAHQYISNAAQRTTDLSLPSGIDLRDEQCGLPPPWPHVNQENATFKPIETSIRESRDPEWDRLKLPREGFFPEDHPPCVG